MQQHQVTRIAATVGTSLAANLRALPEKHTAREAWLQAQPASEREGLQPVMDKLLHAKRQMENGRWPEAGRSLAECMEVFRIMGAEAASLEAILSSDRYTSAKGIFLLHSDTNEGAGCAAALVSFLKERHHKVATPVRIDELDHGRPDRFRVAGLRNLVRAIAKIYRDGGGTGMLIDATGGYKAQTAVAAMTGQLFGAPVVYRFEEFRDIMEFPPLPIRIELAVVEDNLELVQAAARGEGIADETLKILVDGSPTEANPTFARLRVLLEGPVTIDGVSRWELSPFGMALYERWLSRKDHGAALLPDRVGKAVTPDWGAHHRVSGVEPFVDRLISCCPWVTRIVTENASGHTHHPDGVTFNFRKESSDLPDIRCVFVRNNHPEILRIKTTATNREEQAWALRRLIELFGE